MATTRDYPAEDVTNQAQGQPLSTKSKVLETGASLVQDFAPVKQICAHLNAFHVYASDPTRCVEANHYCTHLNEDVRQCLIYDTPHPTARLIGIEYMITPSLYSTLPASERRLWHSHVYEVKSGMLIMPLPHSGSTTGTNTAAAAMPTAAWEAAETSEMKDVIGLYGKTYHLWQTDRGDKVPMGAPELMMSFTDERHLPKGGMEALCGERDERFGMKFFEKSYKRKDIENPEIHEDADSMWKGAGTDA